MEKEELIEIIKQVVPYSMQITDWDIANWESGGFRGVYFTWRVECYYVSRNGFVEEVIREGKILTGSNSSLLMQKLIRDIIEVR